MLSPVLELFVLWHPDDASGAALADELATHFHGGVYSNLLAGSMEVYMRSVGWRAEDDAPRPIPWPWEPAPGGLPAARFVAVVLLMGSALNRAVHDPDDPWQAYVSAVDRARREHPAQAALLPLRMDGVAASGTLARLIGSTQFIAEADPHSQSPEPAPEMRGRDLAQGLAQWISPEDKPRLRVFISHTKRQGTRDEPVAGLVDAVRAVFDSKRVDSFYDAHDLQPGADWDRALRDTAASSALLALRTDLYASREWCQREMLTAKRHGMPVVVLDALSVGEARGSFLMDHTPRIPVRRDAQGQWGADAIRRAINLLADAWLQRVLWLRLHEQAQQGSPLARYWWAPQAPEPSTLASWLPAPPGASALPDASLPPCMPAQGPGSEIRILYPDPPLAEDERRVLQLLVQLAGYGPLDLSTPRLLAARGA